MSGATREVVCTVRLTADEAGRLDAMAASTGRTRSDLLRTMVGTGLGYLSPDVPATKAKSGRTSPRAKPASRVHETVMPETASAVETVTASTPCAHPTAMRRRLPKYGITLCDPDQGGCGARLR